jgi:hypothetical protein
VYAECALGPGGIPVDACIVDPPIVVDEVALALPKRGSVLRTFDSGASPTWHIIDRVGESHYPHVADVVEEVRQMGASRRLNTAAIDFSKITPDTKLMLAHPRAHIVNIAAVYAAYGDWPPAGWVCPRRRTAHTCATAPAQMCAAAWWRDLDAADAVPGPVSLSPRVARRVMPWGAYMGRSRPRDPSPIYAAAIFMILPLTRLVVIEGAHGEHKAGLAMARRAALPVVISQE